MAKPVTIKQLKKGMTMSVSAQVLSLIVSLVLNLIVPKYIDEYQYAYWQTYMLYVSYVGILHFGILDGIVLRYSQYDYDEIDKPLIRSQFLALLIVDSIITSVAIIVACTFIGGINRAIIILVALGIITRNIFTYTSYTFQITNRINNYVLLVISQRLFYGTGILLVLFLGEKNFIWFCIIDLCADLFGVFLGAHFNKGLYFGRIPPASLVFVELKTNISAGLLLMIASWASNLLIGSAKMVVQWNWNALLFGKVSFAFSVSNLFLTFVTAISVVLFPSIKRIEENHLPKLYKSIRELITPLLFILLVFYYPGCLILQKWLPNYVESLRFLGILLPMIIYSTKVSLLTNNYLKAFRKEKKMLIINVSSIACGLSLYLLSALLFDNTDLLLICVVVVLMLRSIWSELEVSKTIHISFIKEFLLEGVLSALFIICASNLKPLVGFLIYSCAVVLYCSSHKSGIKSVGYLLAN